MAKNPSQVIIDLSNKIKKGVDTAFSKIALDVSGQKLADDIKIRTRSGVGVDKSGKRAKFEKLSPSYISQRKGQKAFYTSKQKTRHIYSTENKSYIKRPRLSRYTSPTKSNLTASNQMVEAIRSRSRKGQILIEVANTKRRPGFNGQKTSLTNAELAVIHSNGAIIRHPSGKTIRLQARPFLNATIRQIKSIKNAVARDILKFLRSDI